MIRSKIEKIKCWCTKSLPVILSWSNVCCGCLDFFVLEVRRKVCPLYFCEQNWRMVERNDLLSLLFLHVRSFSKIDCISILMSSMMMFEDFLLLNV